MKNFGTTASALFNSDLIVSSTSCHWSKIVYGCHFKFKNDLEWNTVVKNEEIYWIKDFEVKNRNIISINSNVFPYLQVGDDIEITYKEYELDSIKIISQSGTNYSVGDLIYLDGGNLSPDNSQCSILKVKNTDSEGGIIDFEIINRGQYLIFPQNEITTTSNGGGLGLNIFANFREIEKRGWLDRKITGLTYPNNNTVISLSKSLPDGLQKGKLSVKKWSLKLEKPYSIRGQNIINEPYEIHTDFIPGSNLLKMVKGHSAPDLVINKNNEFLWKKILELEEKINKINKQNE